MVINHAVKAYYAELGSQLLAWRAEGKTFSEIATLANKAGYTNALGRCFSSQTIRRILAKVANQET